MQIITWALVSPKWDAISSRSAGERYFWYKTYALIKDKTSREGILARTHSLPVNAWGALGPGRPAPCGGRLLIIQRLSQLSNVVRGAAVLGGIIQVHRSYLRPTRRAAAGQNHSWDIFHPFTISSYRATAWSFIAPSLLLIIRLRAPESKRLRISES